MPAIDPNDPVWKRIDYSPEKCESKGLNNLIGSALLNKTFREVLLQNPERALQTVSAEGWQSFGDQLTEEERLLVLNHAVGTLRDFAAYMLDGLQSNS